MTMNPEIKDRWLEALRSGEYTQARMALEVNGRFCCLGVLCDLAREDGIVQREVIEDEDLGTVTVMYGGSNCLLPARVKEWAGLDKSDPIIVRIPRAAFLSDIESLADANDGGYTFEEIANIIEEQL